MHIRQNEINLGHSQAANKYIFLNVTLTGSVINKHFTESVVAWLKVGQTNVLHYYLVAMMI